MKNKRIKLTNSYLGGGVNLRNKAFTLIELLAIIIILAIIAVITVPIILNVIDNAKRGSVIDSAYGYKDAIDKYYFTKLAEEDFELDDTYSVSDGKLGGIDIPFTGIGPTNGYLVYENSELESGCLIFDDYRVTYDGSKFISEKGTCPIQKAIIYTDSNGVKYYNTEWIGANEVYYNPVTGAKCDDYHEDNSKTGYNGLTTNGSGENNTASNTECLKWYAYSEQNGNVNLLLDHNTTALVPWIKKDDYNKPYNVENGAQSLGITYPNGSIVGEDSYGEKGNWNKGPITLLNQLKTDTQGWSVVLNRTDSYTASNNYDSETVINRYTINYSGYKARLLTAQEIAYIIGFDSWNEKSKSSDWFYFDNRDQVVPSIRSYGWLYDRTSTSCEIYGCLNNSYEEISGYWTISSYASNFYRAWYVSNRGYMQMTNVNYSSYGSLRPVITVSKSSIFES